MKITSVEPILTGRDVFLKIATDAGIVGYGEPTNNFIPYSSEGMLKDMIPYLIGEDPERIEYLWQASFCRRGGHQRHRHGALGHQGQSLRRAGLPVA